MKNFALAATAIFSVVSAGISTAWAHPGHGQPGPTHYVTEADHVVPVLLGAAVVLLAIIAIASFRKSRLGRQHVPHAGRDQRFDAR